MKILVALDTKKYSKNILKDVARLAKNTWADLVFLGVQGKKTKEPDPELVETLLRYQQDVFNYFSPEDLPYKPFETRKLEPVGKGAWSVSSRGIKSIAIRIGSGNISRQIVSVATETACDLIVMGCSGKLGCEWEGEMSVPLRVAEDAPCSVLVIKEPRSPKQIVSILDQSKISQNSLELINQLVTLHEAGLKIVGLKDSKGSKGDEEKKIVELLKYYNDREISAWIKLLDSAALKDYVAASSREAIVALWMGRKSLIKKLFSQSLVDKLLENTQSSVLILR
ncbi:universal stress protein [Desulfolithobacter sp.]